MDLCRKREAFQELDSRPKRLAIGETCNRPFVENGPHHFIEELHVELDSRGDFESMQSLLDGMPKAIEQQSAILSQMAIGREETSGGNNKSNEESNIGEAASRSKGKTKSWKKEARRQPQRPGSIPIREKVNAMGTLPHPHGDT